MYKRHKSSFINALPHQQCKSKREIIPMEIISKVHMDETEAGEKEPRGVAASVFFVNVCSVIAAVS